MERLDNALVLLLVLLLLWAFPAYLFYIEEKEENDFKKKQEEKEMDIKLRDFVKMFYPQNEEMNLKIECVNGDYFNGEVNDVVNHYGDFKNDKVLSLNVLKVVSFNEKEMIIICNDCDIEND